MRFVPKSPENAFPPPRSVWFEQGSMRGPSYSLNIEYGGDCCRRPPTSRQKIDGGGRRAMNHAGLEGAGILFVGTGAKGSITVKVEPSPTLLWTSIRPRWHSTIQAQMESPRPVPFLVWARA